jgi:PQQ-dependent dehydrogenase (methanol/ethanol family)
MLRALTVLVALSMPGVAAPQEGEWRMPAKDYASLRYSGLADIDASNVRGLKETWNFTTGVQAGHEAAPLVADGRIYVVTPYPNYVFALDFSGKLLWKFDPKTKASSQGVACCDVVNRGMFYDGGRLYFNTLDGQAIALEAKSGKELWRTKLANIDVGETITMAPLVAKGKVLVGNSGGELGVRGWLVALDAKTGKEAWRAYSTGPDKDVLIGGRFKPHYSGDQGKDLGVKSWPGEAWKIGGGTVWGWISYDPQTHLVFYGTGNPGPWNPEQRPGDNKWTAGIFARDIDTGEARWYYQFSPHDEHDYDAVNENLLLDLEVQGKKRPVVLRPERNGYIYVLDRATGEVLSATPYVHITTSLGVDLQSGRLIYNPKTQPKVGRTIRDICPASPGAKDWQPSAYSPRTKLLYIPHQNLCQDAGTYEASYIAGTPYVGADVLMKPGPGGNRGEFTAWDPVAAKPAWSLKENFPVWSGALVTAGDVVFYGTMDGFFKAVDAKSGALLWQFKASSGIIGQPISFRGANGKQHIAVLSGVGGWAGVTVSQEVDTRDGTVGLGFANAMKDLPKYTVKGGMLHVFALP